MNVYGWNDTVRSGGCGWYRIREPLRGLGLLGHNTAYGPELDEKIVSTYETIVSHILWQDAESEAWEILAREGQHQLVFDIDDDVWNYDPSTKNHEFYTPSRLARVERNIQMSALVTVPSEDLANVIAYDRRLNHNVVVLPNYVPERLLTIERPSLDRFTIGYQGAIQHQVDMDMIAEPLYRMFATTDAIAVFYGPGEISAPGWPKDRFQCIPWKEDIDSYYNTLHMTIGIGPLRPILFNRRKSGIRATEYHALGIVGIYQDLPPYRGWVEHGKSGYLVDVRDSKSWYRWMRKLYNEPERLKTMSEYARYRAKEWTTERNAWKWEDAYGGRNRT